MKSAFFLLLRLICYLALAMVLAAAFAALFVWVNGQCPPLSELGVTCATRFSQRLADFGIAVAMFTASTGLPAVLALGGLVFLMRDVLRWWRRA